MSMTKFYLLPCLVTAFAACAFAGVAVNTPGPGAVVASPVHYSAYTTGTSCPRGVASMGVYVNNNLLYVVNGTSMNTNIPLGPGSYDTVVEQWDYCGGAAFMHVPITVGNQSGVSVSSPGNNSTVNSPVNFAATAGTGCPRGVASMGVYVDNSLVYVGQGGRLAASLPISPGTHNTVIEEWDYCGGASFTPVKLNVNGGNVLSQLQRSSWAAYGEYPPAYDICTSCGAGVTWWVGQGVTSPSKSGNATQFTIGGNHPYSDVLWVNRVIGQGSSQNLPDWNHTLIPTLHNFTYDVDFFGSNLGASQVLEFDISMYFNGLSFIWGNQCRIAGGHQWDIWDNINVKWVPANAPCNVNNNAWNHLTLQMQRTWDNKLLFHAITLNGVTSVINRYYSPTTAPSSWYGITINYQMDGNYQQTPYTVFVDNLNFGYW
jgi:hypothetical protein